MKMIDFSVRVCAVDRFEVWGFYEAPLLDLKKEIRSRRAKSRYWFFYGGWHVCILGRLGVYRGGWMYIGEVRYI